MIKKFQSTTHNLIIGYTMAMLLALVASCTSKNTDTTLLGKGVPEQMALYRSSQISDLAYQLHFSIPDALEDSIPASVTLNFKIHDLSKPLYLDFTQDSELPLSLTVNNTDITADFREEHLIIPPKHLKLGQNTVAIDFIAGELSLNRNEDYLYTLLVPDRARTLFPCFDQPDIKASYELTVTAPRDWKVLGGASLQQLKEEGNFTTHQFKQTDKMSTYLFSFVAGTFTSVTNGNRDFPMQMLYRETDSAKIETSTTAIFELHQQSLDFLANYTQYPFPFQKLDFATIPGFQYGGMEHTGAIQYRESALFLDETATQSREIRRAKLIAHEASHMWFGNLVTMKWFDDVWMKEVFANLMADKIINPAFPKIDHDLQFVTAHYPRAYAVDRTKGANAMRQPLGNLNDAGSLYGSIIYNKAPIMMRQLEALLGKEAFQEGLATYMKTYAHSNAEWNDLIAILDTKTNLDLNQWSQVWVNSSGRPLIKGDISYGKENTITTFTIRQEAEDGSTKIWPQQFSIGLVYPDSIQEIPVALNAKKLVISKAKGQPKPLSIIYNYNGLGYGVFPLDMDTLDEIPNITDPVSRGYSYINAYENTLNGNLPLDKAFALFHKGVMTESNALILRGITGNLQRLYWSYLTEKQRALYLVDMENALMERMSKEEASQITKALFNLFSAIAHSENGREMLYRIWKKELKIANLKLNTDDYTRMALQLALLEHPNTAQILEQAKEDIQNPDQLKRFHFLLPAVSQDQKVRADFFESFKEEKNRARESWVTTACNYIHHPLRQETGIKQLDISLNVLEEIQQTGDIFFPKAWLDATIGRYASKEALDMRNRYLEEHPDLNPQLRMKLLQATDHVSRAQGLLKGEQ